jgi:hypothetical protein
VTRLELGAVVAVFAPSDFPGSSADASAASAAVSAAAPAITHRRVQLILASAASRAIAASAGFCPPADVWSRAIVGIFPQSNQLSVRGP